VIYREDEKSLKEASATNIVIALEHMFSNGYQCYYDYLVAVALGLHEE